MIKLGSHITYNKKNKYLWGAAKEALSYDASAMMIYLGAPQNSKRAKVTDMFLESYEKEFETSMPKSNILVHAPYIVNPASVEKHAFAIEFLVEEIQRMNYLGLKQLVLHPGAFTKFTKGDAIMTLVSSLKTIINKTKDVIIHLETMSGKGTEIGDNLKDLRFVYEKVGSKRIGICLDTCHLWDAGYDLGKFDQFLETLKSTKTLELVRSLHINDSKNPLNSHKDRHANIGKGFIDKTILKKFVHAKEFNNIIKVLETPWVDQKPIYKEEIKELKKI